MNELVEEIRALFNSRHWTYEKFQDNEEWQEIAWRALIEPVERILCKHVGHELIESRFLTKPLCKNCVIREEDCDE